MVNSLKSKEDILRASPRMRLAMIERARQEGGDWESFYDHIRLVVDPMDVMSDNQIFGVVIPWRAVE